MHSISDQLNYAGWEPQSNFLLLGDGTSFAGFWRVTPVDCAGRGREFMVRLVTQIQSLLNDSFPEVNGAPWTIQFHCKAGGLGRFKKQYEEHMSELPVHANKEFTAQHVNRMLNHLDTLSQPNGIFFDHTITYNTFRAKSKEVYISAYRNCRYAVRAKYAAQAHGEMTQIRQTLEQSFAAIGMRYERLSQQDFYEWLGPWLSPQPYGRGSDFNQDNPYTGLENDFAAALSANEPDDANTETQSLSLDGIKHRFVSALDFKGSPSIGHFTAERQQGQHFYGLLDQMPEGTVMSLTLMAVPQDEMQDRVEANKKASPAKSGQSGAVRESCEVALDQMSTEEGNKIFPAWLGFYVKGETEQHLESNVHRVASLLNMNGCKALPERRQNDHSFFRNLPANYDDLASWPKNREYRMRPHFTDHLASITPLFGTPQGTGNPTLLYYARDGSPVGFCPTDRAENKHQIFIGKTGSGKSTMLIDQLYHVLAKHNPYVYILEAGQSFKRPMLYLESCGFKTRDLLITPKSDLSLPLFADLNRHEEYQAEDRDVLGESLIILKLMVSGGREEEIKKLTPSDEGALRKSLLETANKIKDTQVLPSHIEQTMIDIANRENNPRLSELAQAMSMYTTGVEGRMFNREFQQLEPADVTRIDFGFFSKEGYEDKRILTFIATLQTVNSLIEARRGQGRETVVIIDECQLFYLLALVVGYTRRITQMWRKLGCSLWSATTSLENFIAEAKVIFTMSEWAYFMRLGDADLKLLPDFKDLTDEELDMIRGMRNQKGSYKEVCILAEAMNTCRVRSIPEPLVMAHAMTEDDEMTWYQNLMNEHNCSELQAAQLIAQSLQEKRQSFVYTPGSQ